MKIQDLVFLVVFLVVLAARTDRLATLIGLLCLVLAIPLFSFWVFFTAQRLVVYAASFFLLAIIFQLFELKRRKA